MVSKHVSCISLIQLPSFYIWRNGSTGKLINWHKFTHPADKRTTLKLRGTTLKTKLHRALALHYSKLGTQRVCLQGFWPTLPVEKGETVLEAQDNSPLLQVSGLRPGGKGLDQTHLSVLSCSEGNPFYLSLAPEPVSSLIHHSGIRQDMSVRSENVCVPQRVKMYPGID